MIVNIVDHTCYVYRELHDPIFRPNNSKSGWGPKGWMGANSRLLHHVKNVLNERGYDLIKKRMWADGHMFGDDDTNYLRRRKTNKLYFCIYDIDCATLIAAEEYNVFGRTTLGVDYGDDSESLDWVRSIESDYPCYEVSWDVACKETPEISSGTMTSGPERYRHYRGFMHPGEAQKFLDSLDGLGSPKLTMIHRLWKERRTG